MLIISAGCSVAAGRYLDQSAKKYSVLLAERYNAELLDIAKPGASNEHISRCCTAIVARALKTYKPSEIVVVVGWTETGRVELFDRQDNIFTSLFLSSQTSFNKTYRRDHWTPAVGYYQFVHSFNYLNSVCRAEGVKIVNLSNLTIFPAKFGNQMDLLVDVATTDSTRVQLKELIARPSFYDFAKKRNMIGRDNYPIAQCHKLWMDQISSTFDKVFVQIS